MLIPVQWATGWSLCLQTCPNSSLASDIELLKFSFCNNSALRYLNPLKKVFVWFRAWSFYWFLVVSPKGTIPSEG